MAQIQLKPQNTSMSYPKTIWWMLSATGVTRTTQFMVMPFLALYMSTHTHSSPSIIGMAVGTSPLVATLFSFVGGSLADRLGRRILMIVAMLLNAVAMVGFANAHAIWMFFAINVFTGLSRALFDPASQAMISDLIPPTQRANVFALDFWMVNIGASIGPVIGGYFGTVATGVTFYAAAAVSFAYSIIILMLFPESKPTHSAESDHAGFRVAVRSIRKDKALLFFILAGTLTYLVYAQVDTTMPQFMQTLMGSAKASRQFSLVISCTGIEVVVLQFIARKVVGRWTIARTFAVSQTLYALAFIGIAFSRNIWGFIISTLILTVGEVMGAPRIGEYVSGLANEHLRGAYFGANSLTNLGFFLGPWLGGIVFHAFGGTHLFLIVALITLLSIPFYITSSAIQARGKIL